MLQYLPQEALFSFFLAFLDLDADKIAGDADLATSEAQDIARLLCVVFFSESIIVTAISTLALRDDTR
jgi:hypothetical protein